VCPACDDKRREEKDFRAEIAELSDRVWILELALQRYDRKTMTKDSEGFVAEATAIRIHSPGRR
jgi:hypothetical protein